MQAEFEIAGGNVRHCGLDFHVLVMPFNMELPEHSRYENLDLQFGESTADTSASTKSKRQIDEGIGGLGLWAFIGRRVFQPTLRDELGALWEVDIALLENLIGHEYVHLQPKHMALASSFTSDLLSYRKLTSFGT